VHQLEACANISLRRDGQGAYIGFARALGDANAPAVGENQLKASSAARLSSGGKAAERYFIQTVGDA
jgi:hypothetical protein